MLASFNVGDQRLVWRDLKEDFQACYARAFDLLLEEKGTVEANHHKAVFELLAVSTLKACNAMTEAKRECQCFALRTSSSLGGGAV